MREYYRFSPGKRHPRAALAPTRYGLIATCKNAAARINIDTRGANKHLLCNRAGRT